MRPARLVVAVASGLLTATAEAADTTASPAASEEITVVGQRLNDARNGIQTQTGASTYVIDAQALENQPGGADNPLNQVLLQAPGVAQDSFGQIHIRGEHNNLQYRLNGIILPEGTSVFGQTLSPRIADQVELITGALPAEYGLRTAGIVDIRTKDGAFEPGGSVALYGGSHGTLRPSVELGGSAGAVNYFVSGSFTQNGLGIESPDGRSDPLHDRTDQGQGFAYFEDVLDPSSRLSIILGTSREQFQIPDQAGQAPQLGLTVNGQTSDPSDRLNENQRELTHYGVVSYLRSEARIDAQVSVFGRYSSLYFTPDPVGDLLYDGIAETAYKRDLAGGVQAEGAYHLNPRHTIRAGVIIEGDRATSATRSLVLPTDANGREISDQPRAILDDGGKTAWTYSAYLQDEWTLWDRLTLNYGGRFDLVDAFTHENQLSPRLNLVWTPTDKTIVHAGYARYFTPPPFELVGSETVAKFANTSAAAAITADARSRAEKANYFDVGVSRKFLPGVTAGLDSYYKNDRNLIDEGQFGAPIILTPFNYAAGRQYGVELSLAYQQGAWTAYGNVAADVAQGRDIVSSQFSFAPSELAYIASHYIHLDHDQTYTGSLGVSYRVAATRLSADLLYGSGLRADGDFPNSHRLPAYAQVNLGVEQTVAVPAAGALVVRFDIINLFDTTYEIRDGTGVGVGAPQFGPRRGFFAGLTKNF